MKQLEESIKFSILIPVYNVENYLEECLDSVLNQTYSNFEVVITNDGSTDNSGEICEKYALTDHRIKVYHQENKGLLLARRNSILHSTGEYYLFLDSDDFWKNNTLEVIYDTIQGTSADMVIFNWDRVMKNDIISSEPVYSHQKEFYGTSKEEIIEEFITTNKLNSLCLKAVKNSILDKDKDYSHLKGLIMGEDALQSIPLFLNAQKIVYITQALYNYRLNDESSTNDFNPSHINDLNVVNESKMNFAKTVNRRDLLTKVSRNHLKVISKQIMLASGSNMTKKDKIVYLQNIQNSSAYIESKKNIKASELILPVRIIIYELDRNNYYSVLNLGMLFNGIWSRLGGLREMVRTST